MRTILAIIMLTATCQAGTISFDLSNVPHLLSAKYMAGSRQGYFETIGGDQKSIEVESFDTWGVDTFFSGKKYMIEFGQNRLFTNPEYYNRDVDISVVQWDRVIPIDGIDVKFSSPGLPEETIRLGTTFTELDDTGLYGDFDNNLRVDGSDFLKWQRGGSTVPFDSVDLNYWQYGFGDFRSGVGAVPEPPAILLAIIGGLLCLLRFIIWHYTGNRPVLG